MKNFKFLLFSLMFVAYFSECRAQTPCAICEEALKHGTQDEFQSETNHTLDESIYTLYSYDYEFWSSYATSAKHNTTLDAAYEVYTFSFGAAGSEAEKKEEFNKQKLSYQYSLSISQMDMENISKKLINKVPYQTFLACVRATCGDGVFLDYSLTGDNFILTASYSITHGVPSPIRLQHITVANAVSLDNNFKTGITSLNPFNSVSGLFKRIDPKQNVEITLDFTNYPAVITEIPKSINQNFNTPVGTIVISELDYGSFCTLNNIPLLGTNEELVWVPADGRDVSGSIYSKVKTIVPDLRGTFLRGLNVFDPTNNPPFARPAQKDPRDRTVDNLEPEDVMPHTHSITDPGHSHLIQLMNGGAGGIGASGNDGSPLIHLDHGTLNAKTGITINKSDGEETRPYNIAVYYYIKIN